MPRRAAAGIKSVFNAPRCYTDSEAERQGDASRQARQEDDVCDELVGELERGLVTRLLKRAKRRLQLASQYTR